MDATMLPTKGNLLNAKNTLRMSRLGYELMDKKRNVLIREIMELNDKAAEIQTQITSSFANAYQSLELACIQMGISYVELVSRGAPIEDSIEVKSRSVMGVEIPRISWDKDEDSTPYYGLSTTSSSFDIAYQEFAKVKALIIELAAIETSAYRLAVSIKKTQKRANSLQNITIPRYEEITKYIEETLEERERDEFTRLKVIKKRK